VIALLDVARQLLADLAQFGILALRRTWIACGVRSRTGKIREELEKVPNRKIVASKRATT